MPQIRGKRKATRNIAHRLARLHRLGDDRQFLLRRVPAPMADTGDDFHLRKRRGHRHSPRSIPGSSDYAARPVQTGSTPTVLSSRAILQAG